MRKYRLKPISYVLILIGVVVALVFTCYNDLKVIYKNKHTVIPNLEKKYNNLLESEETLEGKVVKLQDPEYVAKYAREKYLFTKDGEYIIDLDTDEEKND